MSHCPNCAKTLPENAKFCDACGTTLAGNNNPSPHNRAHCPPPNYGAPHKRKVPRCTHCGYTGNWQMEPVVRPLDWILFVLFLIPFIVPGIVYISIILLIRSNENNRSKICPRCKAQNLWTFIY